MIYSAELLMKSFTILSVRISTLSNSRAQSAEHGCFLARDLDSCEIPTARSAAIVLAWLVHPSLASYIMILSKF